jgi:5'-nucleotidase
MIVSGVNSGANMGDDTIYSGTVAAATEGFLLGIPAIAVSLVGNAHKYFATAASVAAELVARYQRNPIEIPMLLNVNVPDVPHAQLRGFETTRLGKRHKAEGAVKAVNPRGETVYWIGAAGAAADAGPGTDFYATENSRVSITALQIDLTNYQQMKSVGEWLVA